MLMYLIDVLTSPTEENIFDVDVAGTGAGFLAEILEN